MREKSVPDEALDVLACDPARRPPGAPGTDEVSRMSVRVIRKPGVIEATFPGDALDVLRRFVGAEQLCCREIGWEVVEGEPLRLRISSTDQRLDILAGMFSGQHIEHSQ